MSGEEFAAKVRSGRTVWAGGAYDALSARLIEQAGFDAVMTSGFGISSSFLGKPDAEYYTMSENLAVTRNVLGAVGVPVVADIDTGYGNAINVLRTVREFEAAGASAVIIEDQISPKRCPCSADEFPILPLDEAVAKIEAAVSVRRNPNLVIIARTDATAEAEIIRRARAYVAAGADIIQPISKGPKDLAALKRVREAAGVPLSLQLLSWLEKDLGRDDIAQVAGLATFPLVPLMTAAQALRENLAALVSAKSSRALPHRVMDHKEFSDFIGFGEIAELEKKYLRGPA